MTRRFRVIQGGLQKEKAGGLRPLRLYRAYSIGEIEKDGVTYYHVRFNWYRLDRREPVAAMENLVTGYQELDPRRRRLADEEVRRYLTEEEVWDLRLYLRKRYGMEVIAEEVPLPLVNPRGPFGGDPAEVYEFLELSEKEGYPLPFRVWGYYSLKGCLSTPAVDDGRRFLERALTLLNVTQTFTQKELEGVVKALYWEHGLYVKNERREDT